ncbi:hypothetical protein AXF42_Ash012129 [Apostasia shenzhenica]|uniref:Uncharacterized protein n=1 Tax=Apostasia shenzhenica TaxID=1088818 RepID=A0A2I0B426_9ASPA|nr:hypothetical protein AXF42_Ash012129 [Apostasia shenzhenica]
MPHKKKFAKASLLLLVASLLLLAGLLPLLLTTMQASIARCRPRSELLHYCLLHRSSLLLWANRVAAPLATLGGRAVRVSLRGRAEQGENGYRPV